MYIWLYFQNFTIIYHTFISLCHYLYLSLFLLLHARTCIEIYLVCHSNPSQPLHYVIKFVSNLCQVDGFPWYSDFLHQQNWTPGYNRNIVESGIKHHKPKPNLVSTPFPVIYSSCQGDFGVMSYWQHKKILFKLLGISHNMVLWITRCMCIFKE
jgi:hypothetical protein